MNTKLLLFAGLATGIALQLCPTAMANSITVTGSASPNVIIPDGNLAGLSSSINLPTTMVGTITSVTVTVDIAGDANAWNGDYYAYLQYGPDLVVLLNRLGSGTFGSPGNGMNVIFDSSKPNISTAPGLNTAATLTGTYAPQVGNLGSFAGLSSYDGAWTLFIADESTGDVGTLASWSVAMTGTPDTGSTLLLLSMGVGLLGLYSVRQTRTRPVPVSRD